MRTRHGVRLGIGLVTVALVITGAAVSAGACVVGTGSSASCTDAALNACLPGGGSFDGTVTFNCGGPATIDISPGAGGTGTKTISANTTIDGGLLVTISGGSSVRVFSVNNGITFTVRNLTIANGKVAGEGGGIFNDRGTVTVSHSTFDHNSAQVGGGIHNRISGMLTVTDSTFVGNSADVGGGGGISSSGGAVTVTNSTFDQNTTATLDGGGIYSSITTLTVTNSTFVGNSAGRWGGGIINIASGNATITNSTFDKNTAVTGGGIDNRDGNLRLTNTLIANSPAGGDCTNESTFVDGGHNLIEDTGANACGLTDGTNGNIIGQDPNLDAAGLQDNGGPTQTIAVLPGSRAINAGDESICADTSGVAPVNGLDQRSFVRPGVGFPNCTIGAYEYAARPPGAAAPALAPLGLLGLGLLLIGAGAFSAHRRARR